MNECRNTCQLVKTITTGMELQNEQIEKIIRLLDLLMTALDCLYHETGNKTADCGEDVLVLLENIRKLR